MRHVTATNSGLGLTNVCLYQLRHCGMVHHLRSPSRIPSRGRWRTEESACRNAKPCVLHRHLSKLTILDTSCPAQCPRLPTIMGVGAAERRRVSVQICSATRDKSSCVSPGHTFTLNEPRERRVIPGERFCEQHLPWMSVLRTA